MFLLLSGALHVAVPHLDFATLTHLRSVNRECKRTVENEGEWWYKAAKRLFEKCNRLVQIRPSRPDAVYKELMRAYLRPCDVPLWKDYIELLKLARTMHRDVLKMRKKGESTKQVLTFSVNFVMDIIGYDHLKTLAGKRRLLKLSKIMATSGTKVVKDVGFHTTCWMVFQAIIEITKKKL